VAAGSANAAVLLGGRPTNAKLEVAFDQSHLCTWGVHRTIDVVDRVMARCTGIAVHFASREASPSWQWVRPSAYDAVVDTPKVILSYDPPGPEFAITEECQMPTIKVTARLENAVPTPLATAHQWRVHLVFTGANCKHSMNRRIEHPEINASTQSNTFTIPFTLIRGGDLTIEVTGRVGNSMVIGRSQGLKVVGTNPSTAALLRAAIMTDAFKRLMRHESGLQQFRPAQCPYFSRDNLGGVGICQITNPRPTDDQVWSWKENLKRGLQLYKEKENVARAYPRRVREGATFKALVDEFNSDRLAQSTPSAPLRALNIQLPDYTQDQLERDTVRGFNGYAGDGLHEYRVRLDANNKLFVNVDLGGLNGTAEWERVTAAARIAVYQSKGLASTRWGDPDYVENVYRQASF
jgi:hypothetical protein